MFIIFVFILCLLLPINAFAWGYTGHRIIAEIAAGFLSAIILTGCVTTSMQGYADLERPPQPIQHIAAFAPPALVSALAKEALKRGVIVEDALSFLPPTRQYSEPEIRQAMASRGIDGVLVVSVTGDTGVQQQYAGTIVNSSYSGTSSGNAMVMGNMVYGQGMSSGAATSVATPRYRYSRRSRSRHAFPIHRPAVSFGSAVARPRQAVLSL